MAATKAIAELVGKKVTISIRDDNYYLFEVLGLDAANGFIKLNNTENEDGPIWYPFSIINWIRES
ncbi:MAG: hypothetical protein A2087_01080 [Spirochaetes bacterium GWD1_61_31]|nr:MAG: hypothetical protein A2Y37_06605 [Spirochaetes bacterium GWB1_60_80]OHD30461.1 MAG: hypothetical protein A2004_07975 [Spirochaetes bacterium GWC1_61_12]OHD41289.1 MAG: hypothetical protein A2087_01080 [Spirochaetes bacterium GWD1_61_31]OHD44413.1 MAG: hypothetical protein A2Y35_09870 [Spirochaetes bacterium GWE1_60_18]OHD60853.1 MAG: hypothetical protein A2Y32_11625 [Spirochaetes bacterium GWF1_60_12]HAP43814.1 hypothetical protein [Spirochaetaceae bacterium]